MSTATGMEAAGPQRDLRAGPAPDRLPLSRRVWRGLAMPVGGFAAGLLVAAGIMLLRHPGDAAQADALPVRAATDPRLDAVIPRLARLETRLADAETQAERAAAAARRAEELVAATEPRRAVQTDRFIGAALHLQSIVATSRPWLREYELLVTLAPSGALPRPVAEVLASHAARGLPTEAELRERFTTLAAELLRRAPAEGSMAERATASFRRAVASMGLAAPAAPNRSEVAVASIIDHLRRSNLAGAVADAGSLDASLQPLLAGWLAQARARLAVEQAMQETLLRALGRGLHPT